MTQSAGFEYSVHGASANEATANIVLLHGLGHTETIVYDDIKDALPAGGRIFSLRAPHPFGQAPDNGFGWFNIEFNESGPPKPDLEQEASSRQAIADFLDTLDSSLPLVLIGFGQGGVMAAHLFLQHPEKLQMCIVASGRIMPHLLEAYPPGEAHQKVPLILVHGESDPIIPIAAAQAAAEQLGAAGVGLTLMPHPGGHEWPDAFNAPVSTEISTAIQNG
ncbi:alpha/beta hydrolase [Henriciella litoralis]|uniref:alpha/beta hydrolase n=1 Tax=Henriciella litoralis TaxID=568102 RepID=UPI000A0259D5|nr:dienelactone hydrolase family protein [Henriciella litoralis]